MASPENDALIAKLRNTEAVAPGTLEETRSGFEAGTAGFSVANGVSRESVGFGGLNSDVNAEWFRVNDLNQSAVLYLHGGGFMIGSTVSHQALIAAIAVASGCNVLGVNYRLAPEQPFPAALNDSVAAYRYLLEQDYSPDNIAICGDSCGGGLVASTLMSVREQGLPMPSCGVLLSSWADLTLQSESVQRNAESDPLVTEDILAPMIAAYVGDNDASNPLISPVYGDFSGLPSLLIQVGTKDLLEDDSHRLADRAKAEGVDVDLEVWPEMIHVWHMYADFLPEAKEALQKIGDYIKRHIG